MRILNTPSHLTIYVPGEIGAPSLSMIFSFDTDRKSYAPVSIKVDSPLAPFTVTAMKNLPIRRLSLPKLREALAAHNESLRDRPVIKSYFKGTPGRPVAQKFHQKPTEQHLRDAAVIHQVASAVRDYPIKALERSFGLTQKDARRWLSIARQQEILT